MDFGKMTEKRKRIINKSEEYIDGYLIGIEDSLKEENMRKYIYKENKVYRDHLRYTLSLEYNNMDNEKIIDYLIDNPLCLYNDFLEDFRLYKKWIYKNTKSSIINKEKINNMIIKYEKIRDTIKNDFDKKVEEGYFNI